MSFAHSPKIVTDGLVLALDAGNVKSYASGSSTWFDKSGFGNNGTLINGPTFNTGSLGSIVFDGANDYVTSSYVQPLQDSGTSFTWNVWVFPIRNSNADLIIGNRGGAELIFTKLTTNAFEYYPTNISVTLPLNVWQNVCIVKSLTNFTYYRNSTVAGSRVIAISQASRPFFIGGDPTAVGEYFNSRISQVSVYNRALSAQEVLQNYNATKGRFGL
jgi:hypothetical protein